jgi:hypothetical protein
VSARQELDHALEQGDARTDVAPSERRASGGGQSLRSAHGERFVLAPELVPVPRGLLEVVPDDLVLLDELHVCVEPVGEALVQLGPRVLRKRLVRGVAD